MTLFERQSKGVGVKQQAVPCSHKGGMAWQKATSENSLTVHLVSIHWFQSMSSVKVQFNKHEGAVSFSSEPNRLKQPVGTSS